MSSCLSHFRNQTKVKIKISDSAASGKYQPDERLLDEMSGSSFLAGSYGFWGFYPNNLGF